VPPSGLCVTKATRRSVPKNQSPAQNNGRLQAATAAAALRFLFSASSVFSVFFSRWAFAIDFEKSGRGNHYPVCREDTAMNRIAPHRSSILSLILTTAVLVSSGQSAEPARLAETPYGPAPGNHEIDTVLFDWRDAKRDRTVPVKLYVPKSPAKPAPVVVFSHGLGGSRLAYEYLGSHWASHGYAVIHLQHAGSDVEVWRGAANPLQSLRDAIKKPGVAYDRLRDVSFALDQLERLARDDSQYKGRFDLDRVGMSGHSFGAVTTQGIAGLSRTALAREFRYDEPRVKAGFAMSPSPPSGIADNPRKLEEAFGGIRIPMLYMTGTRDDGARITDVTPQQRLLPYEYTKAVDCFQLVFTDGDHGVFAGVSRPGTLLRRGEGPDPKAVRAVVRTVSTAFWNAYLRGDEKAKQWLASDECARWIGEMGDWKWRKAAGRAANADSEQQAK